MSGYEKGTRGMASQFSHIHMIRDRPTHLAVLLLELCIGRGFLDA